MTNANKLLESLPDGDYQRLAPHLKTVQLSFKRVLLKETQHLSHVFFPDSATCCLIKTMRNGQTAEVATVGNEGALGVHVVYGQMDSVVQCVIRSSGEARALSVDAFTSEMERRAALYNLVIRYNQALTNQIMQISACNGLHTAKARCCRWLLTAHDRAGRDEFAFTHAFLAAMLGLRRPTVSLVVASLQSAGLIRYSRGCLMVIDRPELERVSCECHETVTNSFNRLLPELQRAG